MENAISIFTDKKEEFQKLKLHEDLNWEKYNLMSISHHSTAIEGSSLTTTESQLLLDEGITPKGKPFEHSQMEKDHYDAFKFVVKEAAKKLKVSPEFIRNVAAKVMHGTGQEYNVPGGRFDSSKGDYRKLGVFTGETSYPNFRKVEGMVQSLCNQLEKKTDKVKTVKDIYDLAFDFHYDLVSVHPFADGNGRVSRLMMNYILMYHGETPVIIHKEDRLEYIDALKESRKIESTQPIRKFLYAQQTKHFEKHIEARRSGEKDIFFSLLA
ncbi:MAG: Fic family protein [Bacteroidales bacterium]|nr:Fic family protein [Bacteroidales bacterium]